MIQLFPGLKRYLNSWQNLTFVVEMWFYNLIDLILSTLNTGPGLTFLFWQISTNQGIKKNIHPAFVTCCLDVFCFFIPLIGYLLFYYISYISIYAHKENNPLIYTNTSVLVVNAPCKYYWGFPDAYVRNMPISPNRHLCLSSVSHSISHMVKGVFYHLSMYTMTISKKQKHTHPRRPWRPQCNIV